MSNKDNDALSWDDQTDPFSDKNVGVYAITSSDRPQQTKDHLFEDPNNDYEMSVFNDDKVTSIVGCEQLELYKELDERLLLVPERNNLEYTKFMNKLQIQYYLDEIQEKKQRVAQWEEVLLNDATKSKLEAQYKESLKKKIEEVKN